MTTQPNSTQLNYRISMSPNPLTPGCRGKLTLQASAPAGERVQIKALDIVLPLSVDAGVGSLGYSNSSIQGGAPEGWAIQPGSPNGQVRFLPASGDAITVTDTPLFFTIAGIDVSQNAQLLTITVSETALVDGDVVSEDGQVEVSISASLDVADPAGANFSVNPANINPGEKSTLSWSGDNDYQYQLEPQALIAKADRYPAGTNYYPCNHWLHTVALTGDSTFTLTTVNVANGSNQTTDFQSEVSVASPTIVDFQIRSAGSSSSRSDLTIKRDLNESVDLWWKVKNADSVDLYMGSEADGFGKVKTIRFGLGTDNDTPDSQGNFVGRYRVQINMNRRFYIKAGFGEADSYDDQPRQISAASDTVQATLKPPRLFPDDTEQVTSDLFADRLATISWNCENATSIVASYQHYENGGWHSREDEHVFDQAAPVNRMQLEKPFVKKNVVFRAKYETPPSSISLDFGDTQAVLRDSNGATIPTNNDCVWNIDPNVEVPFELSYDDCPIHFQRIDSAKEGSHSFSFAPEKIYKAVVGITAAHIEMSGSSSHDLHALSAHTFDENIVSGRETVEANVEMHLNDNSGHGTNDTATNVDLVAIGLDSDDEHVYLSDKWQSPMNQSSTTNTIAEPYFSHNEKPIEKVVTAVGSFITQYHDGDHQIGRIILNSGVVNLSTSGNPGSMSNVLCAAYSDDATYESQMRPLILGKYRNDPAAFDFKTVDLSSKTSDTKTFDFPVAHSAVFVSRFDASDSDDHNIREFHLPQLTATISGNKVTVNRSGSAYWANKNSNFNASIFKVLLVVTYHNPEDFG